MFRPSMMPNIVLGDLDWLNIESEENIRPRKRQNIITISRKSVVLSFDIRFWFIFFTCLFQATWKVYRPLSSKILVDALEQIIEAITPYSNEQNFDENYSIINEVRFSSTNIRSIRRFFS